MHKSYIIPIAFLLLLSCNSNKQDKKETNETITPDSLNQKTDTLKTGEIYFFEKDSVRVAPFEIEISLNEKAKERITGSNETIIVDIFFTGEPIDSSKVEFEEDGSFYVASAKKEITYGQIASFNDIKFPKALYDQLVDKDVLFNINVYSGRKSSPDNLLDVTFLSGKLSSLVNKRSKLDGKLIRE
jgi:hypothetical protein